MATVFNRNSREILLIDTGAISVVGVPNLNGRTLETSFMPPWILNPRFQLYVTDFAGAGAGRIKIEHSEIPSAWSLLFSEFVVSANGVYEAYSENLTTMRPFSRCRANVTDLDAGVSFTATLVGLCDKQ